MATRTITGTISTNNNTDVAPGKVVSFTVSSDTGAVSNGTISSATLYLSSMKTWSSSGYFKLAYSSGGDVLAQTPAYASNSSAHAETVTLTSIQSGLLSSACSGLYLTVATTSGSGNKFNVRTGCTFTLTITYTLNYTACTAPTSVTVSPTSTSSGGSAKLSWSGASAGTNNAIAKYQIYRATSASGTYSALTTSTSTSTTVYAPTTANASYFYKVASIGTVSGYDSGMSSSYATLKYLVTAPSAPTSVTVSSTNVEPNTSVTLSWSGASAGTNNPIAGYDIYRATSLSGSYEYLVYVSSTSTSGSRTVTAPSTFNASYYYKIITIGTNEPKYNTYSNAYATLTTVTRSGASKVWTSKHVLPNGTNATIGITKTGNVKSINLYYRDSSDGINWGSWNTLATGITASTYSATMPSAGTFRQFNPISVWSNGETTDGTGTCICYNYGSWTDTLTAGSTQIKAVHMTECQNVARAACRCNYDTTSGSSYTTITAGTTQLAGWTSHVNEVRNALNNTGITTSSSWTTISTNNCSAAIMNELRTKATSY